MIISKLIVEFGKLQEEYTQEMGPMTNPPRKLMIITLVGRRIIDRSNWEDNLGSVLVVKKVWPRWLQLVLHAIIGKIKVFFT